MQVPVNVCERAIIAVEILSFYSSNISSGVHSTPKKRTRESNCEFKFLKSVEKSASAVMRGLLLFIVVVFLAVSSSDAQWPNNNNNQQTFPNIPNYNDICSRPGANCQSQSTICDSKGNCKTTTNGSTSVSLSLLSLFGGATMALVWRRFSV
jgi:hypothetical protein